MSTVIYNVLQNAQGDLQLQAKGMDIPEGWAVAAETANPEYLNQLQPVIPYSITRAQAIGALILSGLDESVIQVIEAIPDPIQRKLVKNDWENRLTFERDNPTLIALSAALGMSSSELDQLFIQGEQL